MKQTQIFIFFFLCCFAISLQAQQKYNFPDNAGEFVTYVADMLRKTQKAPSIQTADALTSVWNGSSLNASHKEKVITISKKMVAARGTAAGTYTVFYSALCAAVNESKLNGTQISEFLDVTDKLVSTKNTKDMTLYLDRIEQFFINKALHSSRTNRWYAKGNFKMEYLDKPDEALQKEFGNSVSEEGDSSSLQTGDISGAIIRFQTSDLTLATQFDSTSIKGTQGILLITKNKFLGKGGKFDWAMLDLNPNEVYCEFANYILDVSKPFFKIPNAQLKYTLLLSKVVKGDFEFQSRSRKDVYAADYPKFISNDNSIEIAKLFNELSYKGGFTLQGRKIFSTSKSNQLSVVTGLKNGAEAFKIYARRFAISDSVITSPNVRLSLYMGESDSLYHASLQFKYLKNKHEIQMVRDRNSSASNTPFINNHHEFYIEADAVRYNIEKDSLDIYMISGSQDLRPAIFESFSYFDRDSYATMRGNYDFHPLKLIGKFAEEVNSNTFTVQEIATKYRKSEGIMRNVALDLRSRGYINFEEETGIITLGQRINQSDSSDLFVNVVPKVLNKTANAKDKELYDVFDHDNFRIESRLASKPNASLNRANNELIIRGIKDFPMSEVLNVYIIPDSTKQEVTVYQGRSLFMPKGTITVGNFTFIGQQFFLLYDDFSLEMPIIDKILFNITDTTENDKVTKPYGAEIKFGAGNMNINHPLNKSGRKKGKIAKNEKYDDLKVPEFFEAYPRLNIPQGGEMFFQTSFRQKSAYDSLRAVFKIDPIEMDSINLKLPTFPGTFYSNMFPPIRDYLIPMRQPDLTMGFIHKAPKAGYPIYNGYNGEEGSEKSPHSHINNAKMKFSRDLIMNKDGLFSAGEISYLTTTIQTPEVFFMPDSVQADAIDFNVKSGKVGGAEFAEAAGKKTQLRWLTSEDKMFITNKIEINKLKEAKAKMDEAAFNKNYKEKLLTLYGSRNAMTLEGNITVTAEGLKGDGNLARKDFSIISESEEPFVFKMNKFDASNIQFRINSKERDPYAYDNGTFYAENKAILIGSFVDVEFDLVGGQAKIAKDEEFVDFASFELPYAQYRTSINEVLWDLNKKTIAMTGDSTSLFTATIFGSEDSNEENLRFRAKKAFYDISNLSMVVDGVPYINSADASIVPNKGQVLILKDAEMQELKEARVLIDTLNRYHNLKNGNIRIKSRFEFEGDATYQFANVEKDTFNIKFDKFESIAYDPNSKEGKEVREKIDPKTKRNKGKKRKGAIELKYTFAQGTVNEEDKFYITSRVLYKGNVKMYANRKDLELDGFIKLDLSSRDDYNNWIPYKSDKGDAVSLNIDEKSKIDNDVVTSGLHFVTGVYDMYTTFLSPKRGEGDTDIFLASGALGYTPSINEFKIAPADKKEGKSFVGNQLIFDDSKSAIFLEGSPKLLDGAVAQMVKIAGTAKILTKEKIFSFDNLLVFDLPIAFKGVSTIQSAILTKIPEKSFTLDKSSPLVFKIAEIVGDKAFRKYFDEGLSRGVPIYEAGSELKKPFVFSSVNMIWSDEYKTFYSKDSLLLLNIFDKIFDKHIPGYLEFRKSTAGDGFTLYLQPDPELWYYFEFEQGAFSMLSSDEIFNKEAQGKTAVLAGIDKKEAFINKFREIYKAAELPQGKPKEETPEEGKKEEKKKKDDDDDGF